MSGYLYPEVKAAKAKRARAQRLWEAMTGGENEAGRRKRLREIWSAILQAESVEVLPHHLKIKAMPRVRGAGRAAARAGY